MDFLAMKGSQRGTSAKNDILSFRYLRGTKSSGDEINIYHIFFSGEERFKTFK